MMKNAFTSILQTAAWGKVLSVGLCVAVIGVMVATWQGGSHFGNDFSWANSSYAVEQAYDSTAFQVEEDSDSDNPIAQEEQAEAQLDDTSHSADGYSGNTSSLSGTTVPSEDEVVIGSGGTAQGGNPSQGEGPSGGNNSEPGSDPGQDPGWIIPPDDPDWEPDIIGDPNRFEEVQNPYEDNIGAAVKDELANIVVNGRGRVLADQPMDVARFIRPYVDGYIEVRRGATGAIERLPLNKALLKEYSYTRPSASDAEASVRLSYIDSAYGSGVVTVTCDVYDHVAVFDIPQEHGEGAVRFFKRDELSVSSDIWNAVLADLPRATDGSLEQLFRGWTSPQLSGELVVDKLIAPSRIQTISLVAQPLLNLGDSGYAHLRVEAQDGRQVLVSVSDPTALSAGVLHVPEGVNALVFDSAASYPAIEKIELPATIRDVDVASVVRACPQLKEWSVSSDNPRYTATIDGYLLKKLDANAASDASGVLPDRFSLESIPPSINISGGINVGEYVVAFSKDAFDAFAGISPIVLNFESEEVRFEQWDSIPDKTVLSTPVNSPYDRAYCRYLSAVALHRPGLQVSTPFSGVMRHGGIYEAGADGVVRFRQDDGKNLLAYVPSNVAGSYDVPADVSGITATAFIDCDAIATVVLHDDMDFFETQSLAGAGLNSIAVSSPETISFDAGVAAFGDRSAYPSNFVILLACERGSEGYNRWLDQLTLSWGDSARAQAALLCLGNAPGEVETDAQTGSVYTRDGNRLTLCSVPSSAEQIQIKEGTTAVLGSAFKDCAKLKVVQLPTTVTQVGANAFAGCSSLEAVLYSEAALQGDTPDAWAEQVGLSAVAGCNSMALLESSAAYTSDGKAAVYRSLAREASSDLELAYVVFDITGNLELLPRTVSVAAHAASGRKALESLTAFSSVATVGVEAFAGCENLRSVDGFSSIAALGRRCFAGSGLSGSITLSGVNLAVGEEAFAQCQRLREVLVRGSVSTLGTRTFKDCSYLQRVELGDASTTIATTGNETFKGCASLSTVSISGALRRIGVGAFAECSSLSTVSFIGACKTSLSVIEDEAFRNCVALNGFTLSGLSALKSVGSRFMYIDAVTSRSGSSPVAASSLLITRVTLPASLETIGSYAFGNQAALQTVDISGSNAKLALIDTKAFAGCSSLRQVDMGVSAAPMVVGTSAFEGCASLQRVTLPKSMTTLNNAAFKNCSALASFVLRGSGASAWTILGNEAFAGCTDLNAMDLSSTKIAIIGASAFGGCTSLNLVTLPKSLTALGELAFAGCSALSTLSLLSELPPSVGADTFKGCDKALLCVQVPQSNNDAVLNSYRDDPAWNKALADDSGFFDENSITAADPDMVVYEGASYRRTGSGLSLVEVNPSMVATVFTPTSQATMIEAGAFKGCSSIVSIKVPASVKSIASGAFEGCTNLEILAFEDDRPAAFGGALFGSGSPHNGFKLYVPSGSTNWYGSVPQLEQYRIVTGGSTFALQDGGLLFTSYNAAAPSALEVLFKVPRSFSGSISLTAATDYIADGAAEKCTGLQEIYLGGYCSTVGRRAFKDCTSLTHADLGPLQSNLTGLGESAFEGCTNLKSLMVSNGSKVPIVPRSVSSFGPRVFKGCTSLTYLSIQGPVASIPEGFLEGCTKLGYLTAASSSIASVQSFGDNCFKGCVSMTTAGASLTSFVNLRSIGNDAYAGCTNLSLITLPAAMTSIGSGAFSGCTDVDVVAFNGATPLSLTGTGLDEIIGLARVFVPLGTKDAWQQSFSAPPMTLDEVSATYRAVSGNIYAETRYVSGTEGDLSFVATTKRASASGTVSAYSSGNLHTTAVNARALAGQSHVKAFITGEKCTAIGDRAFDGTGAGAFTLDFTKVKEIPENGLKIALGSKVFGDNVDANGGIRIRVPSEFAQDFIDALSPQLRVDYGMELQVGSTSGSSSYLVFTPDTTVAIDEDAAADEESDAPDASDADAPGAAGESSEEAGSATGDGANDGTDVGAANDGAGGGTDTGTDATGQTPDPSDSGISTSIDAAEAPDGGARTGSLGDNETLNTAHDVARCTSNRATSDASSEKGRA